MRLSGLPRSALLRLLLASDPETTFDVDLPLGKAVGELAEVRLTSGFPVSASSMRTWLAELGEDDDDRQPQQRQDARPSLDAQSSRASPTSRQPSTAGAGANDQVARSLPPPPPPPPPPAFEPTPTESKADIWDGVIDPSLFETMSHPTAAPTFDPAQAASRPPPAPPPAVLSVAGPSTTTMVMPMDIDQAFDANLAPVPVGVEPSPVDDNPPPAALKRKHEHVDSLLGSRSDGEPPETKPRLQDLRSLTTAPAPANPTEAERPNAVAGPSSSTAARRRSTVSIAQSSTSAAHDADGGSNTGGSGGPSVEDLLDEAAARMIPQHSPAPPSTPPPSSLAGGREESSAPEWSSQKPPAVPNSPSAAAGKRKANASPRPGTSKHASGDRLEWDEDATESEPEPEGAENDVASDIDELENSGEEEARVENLLHKLRDLKGKGRASAAPASDHDAVPTHSAGPYPTSSLQSFGIGPLADFCAKAIAAHFSKSLDSMPRLHTERTARSLVQFIAGWAPPGGSFGLFSLQQQRAQLLHQAFLFLLRLRHPLVTVVNVVKMLQTILDTMALALAGPIACDARQVLRTALGDLVLRSSRAEYEGSVPVLKAVWFWDLPASVPALLQTHTQRFIELADPLPDDVHLLASLLNYKTLAAYPDAFAAVYPALERMRQSRQLPHAVAQALEFRIMLRQRAPIKAPVVKGSPAKGSQVKTSPAQGMMSRVSSASQSRPEIPFPPTSASILGQSPAKPEVTAKAPAAPPAPGTSNARPSQLAAPVVHETPTVSAGSPPPSPPPAQPLPPVTHKAPAPPAATNAPANRPPRAAPLSTAQPSAGPSSAISKHALAGLLKPVPPAKFPQGRSNVRVLSNQSVSSASIMASLARLPQSAIAPKRAPAAPAAKPSNLQTPRPSGAAPAKVAVSGPLPTQQAPSPPKPRPATKTPERPSSTQLAEPFDLPSPAASSKPLVASIDKRAQPPASQNTASGPSQDVIVLDDSESGDEVTAADAVRVKASAEFAKVLDDCVARSLTLSTTAERLQARARKLKNTRSCVDFVLDRKHPYLRLGSNAIDVLVRLTTKDERALELPPEQVRRDKAFRQVCRRDIQHGIVSVDDRRYLDRLPTLRGYMQQDLHHEGMVDRHLKEHFKRLRTRKPRTAQHYETARKLLQPVDYYVQGHAGSVLEALVELRAVESDPACLQILGEMIQEFRS